MVLSKRAWRWFLIFLFLDGSATSVEVEEHLYRLANEMGITIVTTSQVSISYSFLLCCFPSS